MAKRKTLRTKTKARTKSPTKPKARTDAGYEGHGVWETTEEALTMGLDEDLVDAWRAIRALGNSFGDQRIYAAGHAIMFSRKVCYFFVRPKKSYLETVIFLPRQLPGPAFKARAASKTRFANTFRLVHADQIEGELAEALAEAYACCPLEPK